VVAAEVMARCVAKMGDYLRRTCGRAAAARQKHAMPEAGLFFFCCYPLVFQGTYGAQHVDVDAVFLRPRRRGCSGVWTAGCELWFWSHCVTCCGSLTLSETFAVCPSARRSYRLSRDSFRRILSSDWSCAVSQVYRVRAKAQE
jgi:hypothetical protein